MFSSELLFLILILPFTIWGLVWKMCFVGPKIFACYFDHHEYEFVEGSGYCWDCKICGARKLQNKEPIEQPPYRNRPFKRPRRRLRTLRQKRS
jgi:hypothetical protein